MTPIHDYRTTSTVYVNHLDDRWIVPNVSASQAITELPQQSPVLSQSKN